MATTVGGMVTKFDALVGKGARGYDLPVKIELLNMAKTEVWKLLVGLHPQYNWFVALSQNTSSGSPDYFPPFTTSAKNYALPPNFHQLRSIKVDTDGYRGTRFVKANLDEDEYLWDETKDNIQFGSRALYDIIGTNPGTFALSLLPPVALDVLLRYSYIPTEWTALTGTGPDEYPAATHGLIAEWAAKRAMIGLGDPRARDFQMEWEERVKRWLYTYRRDNTDEHVVRGYLE